MAEQKSKEPDEPVPDDVAERLPRWCRVVLQIQREVREKKEARP